MKNNLKTKVMLAVLAGNMFCMGSAFAISAYVWYGDPDNANGWKATSRDTIAGRTSGANLTLDGTGSFEDVDHPGEFIAFDAVDIFYGGYSEEDGVEVKNNSITFNTTQASTIYATIYGGQSESGNVANNSLIINGGVFTSDYIYGGYSNSGNATGNTVTIKGGTFSNSNMQIYGGYSGGGDAKDNTVTIEGGTFTDGFSLYGGQAGEGKESSGNILNLKTKITGTAAEVKFFQNVNFTLPVGATSDVTMLKVGTTTPMALADITFTTDLNGLDLTGNDYITLVKGVAGTVGTFTDSGKYHILTIGGVNELVYSNGTPVAKGDYTIKQGSNKFDSGTTGNYTVQINGNTTDGGLSSTSYSGNEVIIRRGTYAPAVGNIAVAGAYNTTTTDAINNNTVKIYDGTFKGIIYGGYSTNGEVSGNTVNIYGGTLGVSPNAINIHGGYSNTNNVTGNVTNIEGGTFAVNAFIYGGASNDGSVTGNKLNIGNGTFSASDNKFYGGYSNNGDVGGDTPEKGNKVIIKNGTFNSGAEIYGGYSKYGSVTGNSVTINDGKFTYCSIRGGSVDDTGGDAIGNSVTINGGNFNSVELFVGYSGQNSSNNILNINTKVKGNFNVVGYAQTMNFTLPSNITNGETMLSTGALAVNGQGGTATVNVYAADGVTLKKDDVITLVKSDNTQDNFIGGDVLDGAGTIALVENDLILTLLKDFGGVGGSDTATTKAIAEGIAASLAFVNQGADMVAGSGIDGLYVADSENPTIAAFSGNKTRYNTGSHVDIHGWNALAGVALNNKESFSHGVFVEIGNGDIDTYAALNGSGSSDYKGGGYMLRKDMGKGWTLDGAVRAGRVETSWGNDTKGGYEAKQTYYGAHVTFNKMLKEYGEQKLNGYLRYTFTHLGSDSVNLDGTHYGFDSVNSHRTRLGARMVDEGQNGFDLYYGAAWEYGFGGDCDATVNGVTTSGPAVDGSNGVFEVGGTWSDNKWEISAGLEGYVGAKRGVAGGMNFIYKF